MAAAKDRFVGSKGGSGIAQWIISQMPVHHSYIECCLGKGVILKTKLSACVNIGIEADPIVISRYWRRCPQTVRIVEGDCLTVLPALKSELPIGPGTLIYCDPPYLGSTRAEPGRVYYGREMLTDLQHSQLLTMLEGLSCMVMISGYHSQLYDIRLKCWRKDSRWTVTRAGTRVQECLWMNFGPPALLHDSRFIGCDFTDRQAIKRKIARWKKKLLAMPYDERFAVLDALRSL